MWQSSWFVNFLTNNLAVLLRNFMYYSFPALAAESNNRRAHRPSKSQHRSSHRRCSVKKGVLRNFVKFTGKHLCQSLFLNKVAGPRPATLLKKSLWHVFFPVNFAKFLRTPSLQSTSGRLLLSEVNKKALLILDILLLNIFSGLNKKLITMNNVEEETKEKKEMMQNPFLSL